MKNIEVELKLPLPSDSSLLSFLQKNASFQKETYQKDSYFAPSHRDFFAVRPVVEWLRIRESDKGNSINYKNRAVKDGKSLNHCDEYETTIKDPEQVALIFQALDIKPVIVVDKKRTSFLYKEIEISVDQVEELGLFVELEMKGEFETPEDAEKYIYDIAHQLGLSTQVVDNKGYPYLLLEKKGLI